MESSKYLFLTYTSIFCGIVLFSIVLNTILIKFSTNLGIRDHDEKTIRWSSSVKPSLGGITFFFSFLIAALSYGIFFEDIGIFKNKTFLALLGSSGIAFIMGFADDAYDTKPALKSGIQFLCAGIIIATDSHIQISSFEIVNIAVTVFWVVGLMNSLNMLDNMDGITSTVSIFIVLTCLISAIFAGQLTSYYFIIMLGVLGSLIAFIFHNWNPSKMFMGDAGSQFIGAFLAFISIRFLWNNDVGELSTQKNICLAITAFIAPLTDTTTVFINRISRGQSPFVGGKDHTTHHLSYFGLSDSQVGFVFVGISAISLLLCTIGIKFIDDWQWYHSLIFAAYCSFIFFSLFVLTKKVKAPTQ